MSEKPQITLMTRIRKIAGTEFSICAIRVICGCILCVILFSVGCRSRSPQISHAEADWEPPQQLSAYGLFKGNGSTQEPADGVVPYDINTPFFSDYATKYRFVRLPPGTSAQYRDGEVFEFPKETTIAKTFAYPNAAA